MRKSEVYGREYQLDPPTQRRVKTEAPRRLNPRPLVVLAAVLLLSALFEPVAWAATLSLSVVLLGSLVFGPKLMVNPLRAWLWR